MNLWRYFGSVIWRTLCVMERVTDMYVLSFINPRLHGVPDRKQHELCTIKVEITHAVEVVVHARTQHWSELTNSYRTPPST